MKIINVISPYRQITGLKPQKHIEDNKTNKSLEVQYRQIPKGFCPTFSAHIIRTSYVKNILNKMEGEVYRIKLINKETRKPVNCYLNYNNSFCKFDGYSSVKIYSEVGKLIGHVRLFAQKTEPTFVKNGEHQYYSELSNLYASGNQKYKGIGKSLIQFCVEKNLKNNSKGKLCILANNNYTNINDPFIFYYKLGFSLTHPSGKPQVIRNYYLEAAKLLQIEDKELINGVEKFKSKSIKEMSLDERYHSLYEFVAQQQKTNLDMVRLNFKEHMYLHENGIKRVLLPEINKNQIINDNNRLK